MGPRGTRSSEAASPGLRDFRLIIPGSSAPTLLVAHDHEPHANGVHEIIRYQSGCDCQGKLGPGGGNQPMLIPGKAAAGVSGAPPAVRNACCDREHNDEREPAVRSVEKSFGPAFPTSQRQTEQSENGSDAHADQGESKC